MIKIARLAALAILMLVKGLAIAGVAKYIGAPSLCHSDEVAYFTCELQGSSKIASVCSFNNLSPDQGYVQYRYGTSEKIEYVFPDKLISPRRRISIVDVARLPDGIGSHIKFTNRAYTYVISNALVPGEIYVLNNGKIVFDKICEGSDFTPFDNAARAGLEYGVIDSVDKFDPSWKLIGQ